ncbi:hypothetical protein RCO07_13605 [Escherichia marmotae]|nr:hypothetical protein [Escherichia marmotae]
MSDLFDVHGGVNPGIELALSKDIAQKVFQIAAMHECRHNFSLNSIKEAWPELTLQVYILILVEDITPMNRNIVF